MFVWHVQLALFFCISIISLAICQVHPFSIIMVQWKTALIEKETNLGGAHVPLNHDCQQNALLASPCWCISGKAWGGDAEDIKLAAEPWSLQSAGNSRRSRLEKNPEKPNIKTVGLLCELYPRTCWCIKNPFTMGWRRKGSWAAICQIDMRLLNCIPLVICH